MIKPYFKHEHNATVVEVEDFGVINLSNLPIRVHLEEKGHYELGWVSTNKDGEDVYVLSEYGGRSSMDFGGRGKSEDGKEATVKELFDDLVSPEPMLLLIDGSLL